MIGVKGLRILFGLEMDIRKTKVFFSFEMNLSKMDEVLFVERWRDEDRCWCHGGRELERIDK